MKQTWTQKVREWWKGLNPGGKKATVGGTLILLMIVATAVTSCVG